MEIGNFLVQLSLVIGLLSAAILFAYKGFKGSARDYDKNTIESLQSSISALEIERDLQKIRITEQDKQIAEMRVQLGALHELVTQRAEVERLHEDLLKFMPLIPAVNQFKEEHERMLYMLQAVINHLEIQPDHKFVKRTSRGKIENRRKEV